MKLFLKYSLTSFVLILLTVTSCQKEDVVDNETIEKAARVKPDRTKPTAGEPKEGNEVGDLNHGGIIFWVSEDKKRGLVCALSDIVIDNGLKGGKRVVTRSWPWGCDGTLVNGAAGEEIGTGRLNTDAILAVCNETGTAADLCAKYKVDNYEDWFLPSYNELMEMYIELRQKTTYGNFNARKYWSSTQVAGTVYYRETYGPFSFDIIQETEAECRWEYDWAPDTEDLGHFFAKGINFASGTDFLDIPCPNYRTKSSTRGVRPVRAYSVEE